MTTHVAYVGKNKTGRIEVKKTEYISGQEEHLNFNEHGELHPLALNSSSISYTFHVYGPRSKKPKIIFRITQDEMNEIINADTD